VNGTVRTSDEELMRRLSENAGVWTSYFTRVVPAIELLYVWHTQPEHVIMQMQIRKPCYRREKRAMPL